MLCVVEALEGKKKKKVWTDNNLEEKSGKRPSDGRGDRGGWRKRIPRRKSIKKLLWCLFFFLWMAKELNCIMQNTTTLSSWHFFSRVPQTHFKRLFKFSRNSTAHLDGIRYMKQRKNNNIDHRLEPTVWHLSRNTNNYKSRSWPVEARLKIEWTGHPLKNPTKNKCLINTQYKTWKERKRRLGEWESKKRICRRW